MNRKNFAVFAALLLSIAYANPATAGLNLWVSQHFAGLDADDSGNYRDAEIVLQAALEEAKKPFRRADTLDALGQIYTAIGDFEQAESYYKDALSLKERALGRRDRTVPKTLNNLADLYYINGKADQVEALYRRALEINERDQLNIEVCRSLNGLALVHNDAAEYVEAEKMLLRAISIHEKAQRRDHPYLATVLTNLGILYMNLGRYEEAEPLYQRANYVQSVSLRPDHPDVAVRLKATATLMQATGRMAEASEALADADAIREKQAAAGDLY